MNNALLICLFLLLMGLPMGSYSQWQLSGELRTRTEFRDGAGTLKLKGNTASVFTSQRSRVTIEYRIPRVLFHSSVQDVRVWGQDASTISATDGSRLGVHEAWAEIVLADRNDSTFRHSPADFIAVRIGRQELSYDDQRLVGGLDWLQQARRHDAAVVKFRNKGWQIDLGAAFNQNTDAFNYNGTFYTPANVLPYLKDSRGNLAPAPAGFIPLVNGAGLSDRNGAPAVQAPASTNGLYQDYKALQFVYAARSFNKTRISLLALADEFGRYVNDSVLNIVGADTGFLYGKHFNRKGVNARFTGGLDITSHLDAEGAFLLTAAFYYQTGRDRDALRLSAWTSTISLAYSHSGITGIAGWDRLSGNNAFAASATNHRFDPLYGTPHKFWGNMDYFYVSTGAPSGGLSNPFAKLRYSTTRLSTELGYHYFALASNQRATDGSRVNKYLGSELDLVCSWSLNSATRVEYGFSLMAASRSMEYAKNIAPGAADLTGLWSYLMVTILLNSHQNQKK